MDPETQQIDRAEVTTALSSIQRTAKLGNLLSRLLDDPTFDTWMGTSVQNEIDNMRGVALTSDYPDQTWKVQIVTELLILAVLLQISEDQEMPNYVRIALSASGMVTQLIQYFRGSNTAAWMELLRDQQWMQAAQALTSGSGTALSTITPSSAAAQAAAAAAAAGTASSFSQPSLQLSPPSASPSYPLVQAQGEPGTIVPYSQPGTIQQYSPLSQAQSGPGTMVPYDQSGTIQQYPPPSQPLLTATSATGATSSGLPALPYSPTNQTQVYDDDAEITGMTRRRSAGSLRFEDEAPPASQRRIHTGPSNGSVKFEDE